MKHKRMGFAASLAAAWLSVAIQVAGAQEMYDRSTPGDGETIKSSPSEIHIIFLEGIYLMDVRLKSEDGAEWPIDWKKTEEDIFNTTFHSAKELPPGKYEILWEAYVRQHRHSDGGAIKFIVHP
jgi:methionine-rich copper-binding protein CopC